MNYKIKYLLVVIFTAFSICGFAQKEYDQWYFGAGAALDFSSGNPVAKSGSAMHNSEGTASIADCNGKLLFYTDGITVWNKNNKQMPNGNNLHGDAFSTQSALILKRPNSSNIYYIFTASDNSGLQYSIVNMTTNGGLGDVTSKNISLNTSGTEKITVTRHANGQDAWIITHLEDSDEFDAFLVTSAGVSTSPVASFSGPVHTSGHGDIKISPKGNKILTCVEFMDLVSLSDFNNSTGVVSNTNTTYKFPQPHGGEFSANGNLAYVSSACFFGSNCTNTGISQLNLLSPTLVMWSTSIKVSGSSRTWGSLRRHSNGVIYCTDDGSSFLGTIANPDVLGTGCNYNHNSIFLGGNKAGWELPNDILTSAPIAPGAVDFTITGGVCPEDPYTFKIISAQPVISASWDFGDPASGFSNFSSLTQTTHKFSATGTYTISVFINVDGCHTITLNKTLTVNKNPTADAGVDVSVCLGSTVNIGENSSSGVTYSWTPNDKISNPNISNPLVWPLTPRYYYLKTTDAKGCNAFDTVFVLASGTVPPNAGPDTSICLNDSVKIGGNLKAPNNTTYSWIPATGLSNSHIPNPMASPATTTKYYLYSQNDTCAGLDSMILTVHALPPVIASSSKSEICFGDSTQLNAVGALSYIWSPAGNINNINIQSPLVFPKQNTFYKVMGTDVFSCKNSDSIEVVVNPLPISTAGLDTGLCVNDTIQLQASGTGTYLWQPSAGLSDSTIENPLVYTTKSIVYTLLVTDVKGCKKKDSIKVVVHTPQAFTLDNTLICEGSSQQLWAKGGVKYKWWPGESLSDSTIANPVAKPISPTTYYVEVTDSYKCIDTASFQISLNIVPTSVFSIVKQTPSCEGFRTEFTNTSINADSQLWIYGDGTISSEKVPQHTYPFGKNVQTSLIVTNNGICHDTMSLSLDIKSISDAVTIANGNVLTLNNDNINDCFSVEVKDEFQGCVSLRIYDRWGLLMYENKAYAYGECWDGKSNLTKQWVNPGTYYYIISIKDYSKTGYITVF
ncbi:MAG: gliding motility-associated C-terminal domain-containing protein [Bacteroidetes bacterium]|nr:gliding motility-associated C-terminal domain-containing protein [Bacteroidota bacterium]